MTEIPDYLLQRSRERRAALGGGGDGVEGAASPAPTADSAPAPAASASPVPAAPDPGEIEKVEPPKPVAPWVKAAQERKKIPVWMAPVALFIPMWAFMIWGTLEEPTRPAEGPIAAGGEVYIGCAGCHGAGGGGGSGYQLNGGEVVKTFPNVPEQIAWVLNGSPGIGVAYGDPSREGGQRISGDLNGGQMPAQAVDALHALEVVLYERVTHGLEDPAKLEAWILFAESPEFPEWTEGILSGQILLDFNAFVESNPEAQAIVEELAAQAAE